MNPADEPAAADEWTKGGRTRVVHPFGVWIHVALTRKQAAKLRKKLTALEEPGHDLRAGTAGVQEVDSGVYHVAVFLDRDTHRELEPGVLINTVAHEAAHAAGMILDHAGEEVDSLGSSEVHAYLVGWVAEWLWHHATA